jgi:hypothetical protein
MLKKSSAFMMFLVTSASFLVIASVYQPANIMTQPLQQVPNSGPLLKQPPPILTQQPQKQQAPLLGTMCGPICVQAGEDQKLVNRLFPYIIQKIDGKTLAQKIDTETLIQKIGTKRLAEIVLQHTQLIFSTGPHESQLLTVKKSGPSPPATVHPVVASCPQGTKITGGGVVIMAGNDDNQIMESRIGQLQNTWSGVVRMSSSGSFYAQAVCMGVILKIID